MPESGSCRNSVKTAIWFGQEEKVRVKTLVVECPLQGMLLSCVAGAAISGSYTGSKHALHVRERGGGSFLWHNNAVVCYDLARVLSILLLRLAS